MNDCNFGSRSGIEKDALLLCFHNFVLRVEACFGEKRTALSRNLLHLQKKFAHALDCTIFKGGAAPKAHEGARSVGCLYQHETMLLKKHYFIAWKQVATKRLTSHAMRLNNGCLFVLLLITRFVAYESIEGSGVVDRQQSKPASWDFRQLFRTPCVRCAQVIKIRVKTLHVCEGNSPKHNKTNKINPPKQNKTKNPQTKLAEFRAVL